MLRVSCATPNWKRWQIIRDQVDSQRVLCSQDNNELKEISLQLSPELTSLRRHCHSLGISGLSRFIDMGHWRGRRNLLLLAGRET